jgi:cytochrome c oxidase subunit 2
MKNRLFLLTVLSLACWTGAAFAQTEPARSQDYLPKPALGPANEKIFEVRARKFSYSPHIITVNKGDTVRIRLISEDVTHGLFVDGYNVQTTAHPGQDGSIKFVADKTGRFTYRCSVTCGEFHPYMIGYLIVEPNSRFWFYVALVIFLGIASFGFIILRTENGTASESLPDKENQDAPR